MTRPRPWPAASPSCSRRRVRNASSRGWVGRCAPERCWSTGARTRPTSRWSARTRSAPRRRRPCRRRCSGQRSRKRWAPATPRRCRSTWMRYVSASRTTATCSPASSLAVNARRPRERRGEGPARLIRLWRVDRGARAPPAPRARAPGPRAAACWKRTTGYNRKMTQRPLAKTVNAVKATLDARRGPVSKDQDTIPIADAMRAFHERAMLSFSIPAHSGARGPAPAVTRWAGLDAARFDLPMSHGVDTRDRAWQVQSTAQELFADAVGAKQVLFSTNGSSMSVHVALLTVAGGGGTIVMARNGHKSAFAGLVLSGARPVYVDPVYDEGLEIALGPRPDDLARAPDAHADAKAALVLTPSYYGPSARVEGLADVCHARDIPLTPDDAWGLDYALSGHPDLPDGA